MLEALAIVGASFLWLCIAQYDATPVARYIDSSVAGVAWFIAVATYYILREIRKGRLP